MKKRYIRLNSYVVAVGLFMMAVVLAILLFFGCIQTSVGSSSRQTMMNNVSRQSEHLRMILDIHYQYLGEIAEEMSKDDPLLSEKNKDMLITICNRTDLERVALIEPDGTAHYDTGETKNVSHRNYFKEALEGKRILSDPIESSVDHEVRVVIGVPVYKENKVIGILGGSYNVTALSRMMFDDLFDGNGYSLITDKNGTVVTYDGVHTEGEQEEQLKNLFEYFKGRYVMTTDIKDDFATGKEGICQFKLSEGKKVSYYMAYTPLEINDWMMCYIVPVRVAEASYDFIREYEIVFIVAFGISVAVFISFILYKNRKEKARLLKRAQRDALTGLYNKKTTQDMIEKYLEDKGKEKYSGFLIMDIDYFKQVNDTYGHLTGDEVLKIFGRLLYRQFREQDIVGRIGGDEFMVLIREIKSMDIAKNRVKKLIEEVRSLRIPQLNGNGITISVGIAFAPDHGTNFMELYRHADIALYQVKQGGRNGFSIYKKCI